MFKGQRYSTRRRAPSAALLHWEMVLNLGSKPHGFQVQHFLVELCQHGPGMTDCLLCVSGMCLV